MMFNMKSLAIAAAALMVSAGAAFADLTQKTEQMFNPVVQLNGCSGTLIKSARDQESGEVETIVLSARHCFDRQKIGDPVEVNVFNYNDQNRLVSTTVYRGELYRNSFLSDLSLVRLRDTNTYFGHRLAKIAAEDTTLTFGMDVHVVGHPGTKSLTYTQGNLGFVEDDMFKKYSRSGQFYRATPLTAGGSSGSAMFAEVNGNYEIIGVLTGGWMFGPWANHFTPLEEIHKFLDQSRLDVKDFVRQ